MKHLKDKVILITGGTGSFGNAVVMRLLKVPCAEIRIFSRDEKKQYDMRLMYNDPRLQFYIGDVRDSECLKSAMRGVDYVFHAAALKQVPSTEFFPLQAVKTNILGSSNVIEAAIAHKVKTLVCLSTDKAVMPVNAMGMTKAVMEKLVQATARDRYNSKTTVTCVRYGNVMLSRGSVIPLLIEQIKSGKPLTLTDSAMTRFMLPLSDAVDLVLFAMAHAKPGDTFIKKAPACTVGQLADALRTIFGARNKTKVIGIRPGEKLHEMLATSAELHRAEEFDEFLRIPIETNSLDYNKYFAVGEQRSQMDYTSENTNRLKSDELEALLLSLPEIEEYLKSENDAVA